MHSISRTDFIAELSRKNRENRHKKAQLLAEQAKNESKCPDCKVEMRLGFNMYTCPECDRIVHVLLEDPDAFENRAGSHSRQYGLRAGRGERSRGHIIGAVSNGSGQLKTATTNIESVLNELKQSKPPIIVPANIKAQIIGSFGKIYGDQNNKHILKEKKQKGLILALLVQFCSEAKVAIDAKSFPAPLYKCLTIGRKLIREFNNAGILDIDMNKVSVDAHALPTLVKLKMEQKYLPLIKAYITAFHDNNIEVETNSAISTVIQCIIYAISKKTEKPVKIEDVIATNKITVNTFNTCYATVIQYSFLPEIRDEYKKLKLLPPDFSSYPLPGSAYCDPVVEGDKNPRVFVTATNTAFKEIIDGKDQDMVLDCSTVGDSLEPRGDILVVRYVDNKKAPILKKIKDYKSKSKSKLKPFSQSSIILNMRCVDIGNEVTIKVFSRDSVAISNGKREDLSDAVGVANYVARYLSESLNRDIRVKNPIRAEMINYRCHYPNFRYKFNIRKVHDYFVKMKGQKFSGGFEIVQILMKLDVYNDLIIYIKTPAGNQVSIKLWKTGKINYVSLKNTANMPIIHEWFISSLKKAPEDVVYDADKNLKRLKEIRQKVLNDMIKK